MKKSPPPRPPGDATIFIEPSFNPPVGFTEADRRAGALLAQMTREEKLSLITGHNFFWIRGVPRLGVPELYLCDATQGLNLRKNHNATLRRSTAFPAPILLAATWNPKLAHRYARAVGEECRAGGVAVLLGPGVNIYRVSQCGRNFEYFGEDPFLSARITERYVAGVLETGTIPTLKHFAANNSDHRRRTSDSVVDERTLHEIYLPAFKAGIAAGAMAVMTAYNLLNGEWCGQSRAVIHDLLRRQLGFKWLVMSDWWSVWDAEKIIKSGQDLEMPGEKFLAADTDRLLRSGKVSRAETDRMARSILRTTIAMGLHDRPVRDDYFLRKFPEHERTALDTAREGIVLLKHNGVLPLPRKGAGKILVTGLFVEQLARGGGSANVAGYNVVTLLAALRDTYGARLQFVKEPTDAQLRAAKVVLLSTGTLDNEGWDRPFALPATEEAHVTRAVALNPRTVVIINSGGGVRMTDWHSRAAAIIHAFYPGQIGNRALAEILCGDTNPSGKLPFTIEREFAHTPGLGYLPPDEELYVGPEKDNDMGHPVHRVEYKEGVFVGYRWFEAKKIRPLYTFGHGLSYTKYKYSKLTLSTSVLAPGTRLGVDFTLTNTGQTAGAEIAQVYVQPVNAPVPRPVKELKGFAKVALNPGETRPVNVRLGTSDFAYWDVKRGALHAAPGEYRILVGGASDRIVLRATVTLR